MIRSLSVLFILFYICCGAVASTTFPRQLTESDRKTAAGILSFGSMMKLLSNPYPLGGYDGVEVGFASEYIPLENVAALGAKSDDKGEYNYYTISLGKGLFYNIDTFLQFTPLPQSEGMSSFGAQVRWGFYEAAFFPFSLSLVLNGGGSSFSSLINSTMLGADVVGVVDMNNVAVYFGVGQARSSTRFIGGANGLTDDGETHQVNLTKGHQLFGVHLKMDKFFVALEVDRYQEASYGGKLGMRF